MRLAICGISCATDSSVIHTARHREQLRRLLASRPASCSPSGCTGSTRAVATSWAWRRTTSTSCTVSSGARGVVCRRPDRRCRVAPGPTVAVLEVDADDTSVLVSCGWRTGCWPPWRRASWGSGATAASWSCSAATGAISVDGSIMGGELEQRGSGRCTSTVTARSRVAASTRMPRSGAELPKLARRRCDPVAGPDAGGLAPGLPRRARAGDPDATRRLAGAVSRGRRRPTQCRGRRVVFRPHGRGGLRVAPGAETPVRARSPARTRGSAKRWPRDWRAAASGRGGSARRVTRTGRGGEAAGRGTRVRTSWRSTSTTTRP